MSRKVMMITGAGRGIGAATARMAAARGYDLCLTYQKDSASAEVVQRDCEAAGAKVLLLQGSVEDEAHAIGAFEAVIKHFGRIDVLVNNAGGTGPRGRLETITDSVGRSSTPGVFAIGDGAAIGGARVALARGRLAGLAAAHELGFGTGDDAEARDALTRAEAFQRALWCIYAAPAFDPARITDDTILCRCEEVRAGEIRAAISAGAAFRHGLHERGDFSGVITWRGLHSNEGLQGCDERIATTAHAFGDLQGVFIRGGWQVFWHSTGELIGKGCVLQKLTPEVLRNILIRGLLQDGWQGRKGIGATVHGQCNKRLTTHVGRLIFSDELLESLHGFTATDEAHCRQGFTAEGLVFFRGGKLSECGDEFSLLPLTRETNGGELHVTRR